MTAVMFFGKLACELYHGQFKPVTMKTIVVLNDGSSAAAHAAKLAYMIAKKVQATLLLVETSKIKAAVTSKIMAVASFQTPVVKNLLLETLSELDQTAAGHSPELTTVEMYSASAAQLAELANTKNAWMVVYGISITSASARELNLQSLLNKLCCPLLIVPEHWDLKPVERLTYIADLRYCRLSIVRFLAELAEPLQAAFSIAHLSAKGLPPIEENYGRQLFADNIAVKVKYKKPGFNNIREKDVRKAVDVIINGMRNDMLALVNHRFHFKEIIGDYLTHQLSAHLSIPLLLFPY